MVRFAKKEDVVNIVDLILPYHKECVNELTSIPCDRNIIFNNLWNFVDNILVYERNGDIIGVLIFAQVQTWWADDYYFSDVLFYIKPEHRKGMAGGRLVAKLLAIAKAEGKVVQLAGLNGTQGVNNDYSKRFTEVGSVFLTRGK